MRGDTIKNNHKIATLVIAALVFSLSAGASVSANSSVAWVDVTSGTTADLYGIWGAGSSDIYAVGGSGTVIHYNGTGWAAMTSGTAAELYDIWGADNTHVFVAGQSGVILNFNGIRFSSRNRNTAKDLSSVWGLSDCNIFISGSSGTILRYFPPSIYEISPDEGHQSETLNLTITGNNFTGTTAVQFGVGISVNSFNVLNSNQIDASITIVYNAVAGLRDVSVTTPWGSFTFADGFTVKPALPVITSISPDSGNQGTMLNVTITGDNFTGATAVQFGAGISVNSFSILSSNQIAASITIAADAAVGARDISVTNAGGSFTLPSGFTIKQALPVITSVEPSQERQGATLNVTITGMALFTVKPSDIVKLPQGVVTDTSLRPATAL